MTPYTTILDMGRNGCPTINGAGRNATTPRSYHGVAERQFTARSNRCLVSLDFSSSYQDSQNSESAKYDWAPTKGALTRRLPSVDFRSMSKLRPNKTTWIILRKPLSAWAFLGVVAVSALQAAWTKKVDCSCSWFHSFRFLRTNPDVAACYFGVDEARLFAEPQ